MDIKEIAKGEDGVVALSKALGLSRGAVSQWKVVPSDRVLAVCAALGWRVTPHQLRPDIYPNPADALPACTDESAGWRTGIERRADDRRHDCDCEKDTPQDKAAA